MTCGIWWSGEIRLGDLISALSMLVAAFALFLNWWQAKRNAIQQRGQYIAGLFSEYLKEPDTTAIFYKLEYDKFTYSLSMEGTDEEIKLDKLLANYDRIAALHEMGLLSFDDLRFMEYEFVRVAKNTAVQEYLKDLDKWYEDERIPGPAFPSFRRAAEKLQEKCPRGEK